MSTSSYYIKVVAEKDTELERLKTLITELCDALDIWSQHQATSLIQRARDAVSLSNGR